MEPRRSLLDASVDVTEARNVPARQPSSGEVDPRYWTTRRGVRLAYLQTDRHEEPTGDMIFRIRLVRRLPTPTARCPSSARARSPPHPSNVTCTSCRLCHR